jgi:hypothetical protein
MREYRTLRMSKFFSGFIPKILYPKASLTIIPKDAKKHHKSANLIKGFLRAFERQFNPSQLIAL